MHTRQFLPTSSGFNVLSWCFSKKAFTKGLDPFRLSLAIVSHRWQVHDVARFIKIDVPNEHHSLTKSSEAGLEEAPTSTELLCFKRQI